MRAVGTLLAMQSQSCVKGRPNVDDSVDAKESQLDQANKGGRAE